MYVCHIKLWLVDVKGCAWYICSITKKLGYDWQPKQVTIGFFEAIETVGQTLVLTKLFNQYGLRNKIIAYVKDEGSNLNTMTITLKSIVKCEVLGIDESF